MFARKLGITVAIVICLVASISAAQAENVIIMISDGWSYNIMQAAKQWRGEALQPYEKWPVRLAMTHFPAESGYDPQKAWAFDNSTGECYADRDYINQGYTDSAASATAFCTGQKTYNGRVNVSTESAKLVTLAELAKANNMSCGVVSSVCWSHATPATFSGAHNIDRNKYEEIAKEMVYSPTCDVIMGPGHPEYDNSGNPADMSTKYVGGNDTWQALKNNRIDGLQFIEKREDFVKYATGPTPDRVIGTARVHASLSHARDGYQEDDMPYEDPLIETVPTLAEMTKAALNILDENESGLFLMIEGGAVDKANHANWGARAIEEQTEFDMAVAAVIDWVEKNSSWDETTVVVTGDHECGMLLGKNGEADIRPGKKGEMPEMKYFSGDHSNQLIPFFAKGCRAYEFVKLANCEDRVRGAYIDNTDVYKVFSVNMSCTE